MIFCILWIYNPFSKYSCQKMNHRSIIRASYIQNYSILSMASTNKQNNSEYDYSGLFVDDEELS